MTAKQFYNFHRSQFDGWEHGEIKEVWTDTDGNTCIRYADEKWWHFTRLQYNLFAVFSNHLL